MKYSHSDIEFCTSDEIEIFQNERLQEALRYLWEHSPFYQRMFRSHHIDINEIRTIQDLQLLPFTEKKDLQLYNNDFLCVPQYKIIDYITTSGTLGDPVTFGCTDRDLDRLAYNEKIKYMTKI